MPLSEQEQRLLDEMERSLYHNDADDVTTVGARRGRSSYTAIVIGLLGALIGVALLILGVSIRQPVVGIVGFVVMFAGVLFAVAPPRRLTVPANAPRSAGRRPRQSFMDSLNERWERRGDDQDQ